MASSRRTGGNPTAAASQSLPQPESEPLPERTRAQLREIIARYPKPRSALLPMLHLVQSEQDYVSAEGVGLCAEELGLTQAEVGAVATFYTMYKRKPCGDYLVGVCTNTLCAILGGDAILAELKDHLGIGNNETTPDGAVTLEHIECNAACDYAPVIMVNWEFFDNQTPASARELVDRLRAGDPPPPTRGAPLCTWRETERILAGFPDERPNSADAGPGAGPATLAGLALVRDQQAGAGKRPAAASTPDLARPGAHPASAPETRT